jgi:membrane-associated protease RseP (regulator of RpoE activity)
VEIIMKRLAYLTVAIILTPALHLWAGDERPNPYPAGGTAVPGQSLLRLQGQISQYWIGLHVIPLTAEQRKKLELPEDQGLTVLAVMSESPAAKAGIKTSDVILKAGDRVLKGVPDLVQAVEKAKQGDLVLEIIRDGKKQKVTVKPAKRPAEGVVGFRVEGGAGEIDLDAQSTVRRLPGGGLQVIIGEGNKSDEGQTAKPLDAARQELEKARASAQAGLGQRIKLRHELAEKAWQAYQKMQSLGADKKGEAHELWEQIESLEGQLRQTFAPAGGGMMFAPGVPLNGVWTAPPGVQLVPGAQAGFGERRQDAAIQELRTQVEQLRRDVEELKARPKTHKKKHVEEK